MDDPVVTIDETRSRLRLTGPQTWVLQQILRAAARQSPDYDLLIVSYRRGDDHADVAAGRHRRDQ